MRRTRHLTRHLTSLAAVATVAAAVVLAACSGEDTNNLSKGEFATKANALCSKAESERTLLLQQLPPMPSGDADTQTLRRIVTVDRELVRKVDDLVPPQAEQDRVDRLLDAWRRRAELESRYADAVAAAQSPQPLATFTASVAQVDATAQPTATQLGLTQCAPGAA